MKNKLVLGFALAGLLAGTIVGWLVFTVPRADEKVLFESPQNKRSPHSVKATPQSEGRRPSNHASSGHSSAKDGLDDLRAVLNKIRGLDGDGCRQMLDQNSEFSSLVYARWVEIAPEDAFVHAKTRGLKVWGGGAAGARASHLRQVLIPWMLLDHQAVIVFVENGSTSDEIRGRDMYVPVGQELIIVAREWAKDDFDAAFSWAEELKQRKIPGNKSVIVDLLRTLTTKDHPTAAQKIVDLVAADSSFFDGPYSRSIISQVAAEMAKKDQNFTSAKAFLLKFHDEKDLWRDYYLGPTALKGLAQTNPQAAIAVLKENPELPTSGLAYQMVSDSWAQHDPKGALTWALERKDRTDALRVVDQWAEQNPAEVLKFAQSREIPSERALIMEGYTKADERRRQ